MDLGGPKFRIGEVRRQTGERLHEDDRFRLVVDVSAFVGDAMLEAVCEPGDVLERLTLGTDVVFDDGKLAGVVEARGRGSVQIRVTRAQRKGFKMKPERGLTFPRRTWATSTSLRRTPTWWGSRSSTSPRKPLV